MEQVVGAPTLMPDWLSQRAHLSPDRLALRAGNRQWSYRELNREVSRAARALVALGVRRGDRVAVLLRNGSPFVVLVHALTRLGAILVPLNTRLTAPELGWQLDDVEARLLLLDAHHADLAEKLAGLQPALPRVMVATDTTQGDLIAEKWLPGDISGDTLLRDQIDLSAEQSIIYTSGTTGRPKGALITYGNLWWSAVGSALNLGHHLDDCWLACLPLFHVGGLSILFRCVIYGIAAIVHEAFDASAVNAAIDQYGVTLISVVSTMLQRMLEERGGRPYPPSLRCVLVGGGPVPPSLLESSMRQKIPVVQTYGLTEAASQVATLAPEDARRKIGSAGKPLLPTELRIERDGVSVQPAEVGEIVVRGPTISPGYFGGEMRGERGDRGQGTADGRRETDGRVAATPAGWLRTGDLGYLDDEGFLYVLDRRDDLIVSGGENIYPAEVEAVLQAHPAVDGAGVVGIPHAVWGQSVVAAVILHSGTDLTVDDLVAFCRQRLAGYKVPTQIHFIHALPRNATGKLLRRRLREDWLSEPTHVDGAAKNSTIAPKRQK